MCPLPTFLASTGRMRYTSQMTSTVENRSFSMPFDDDYADMMAYASSPEGRAKIACTQAEIDEGLGMLADDAYFEKLQERVDT